MKLNMLERRGLARRLLAFALPIIGSGVVQQSFNSIDVAVVGRYIGSDALAAVGANGAVISLIITMFMGVSLGVNVVISRALGSKDTDRVRRSVSTQALFSILAGIFLLLIAEGIARPILEALDTPASILGQAVLYLKIYALGFPAMMIYNFSSAVLRSIGDTLRPFLWLVAAGVINVVLNLLFVTTCHMGVEGVALATTISGYVSAAGVVWLLLREKSSVRLRSLKFYPEVFGQMLRIGLPAGVQGTLFALSNIIVQSAVNHFGPIVMAGNTAAIIFEVYGYFIISAFVQAAVAFVSINYGAGQWAMCRRVVLYCMLMGGVCTLMLNSMVAYWGDWAIGLMCKDTQAIHYGVIRLHIVLVWQFIAISYEVAGGAMRGYGYSLLPMAIALVGTCVVRIVYVKCMAQHMDLQSLLCIYPATWAITGIGMLIAYFIIQSRVLRPLYTSSMSNNQAV